jgi:hypothetical protein
MDENTTTVAPADANDPDAPILPDEDIGVSEDTQETTTADETANEQTEETTEGDEQSQPDVDAKLKRYAESQGLELDSPSAIKAARIAMQNQSEVTRNHLKASELEKSLQSAELPAMGGDDTVNQLVAEVQGLKIIQNVNSFFSANPDAKALEDKMTDIVVERPEIGQLVKLGHLSMNDLYNLARGADNSRDEKLKADGGREALKKVARKQQAKAVPGAATSSDLSTAQEDAFLNAFDSM